MIIQKDEETNRIRQQLLEEKEVARNKKIDLTNEKKEKVSNVYMLYLLGSSNLNSG